MLPILQRRAAGALLISERAPEWSAAIDFGQDLLSLLSIITHSLSDNFPPAEQSRRRHMLTEGMRSRPASVRMRSAVGPRLPILFHLFPQSHWHM